MENGGGLDTYLDDLVLPQCTCLAQQTDKFGCQNTGSRIVLHVCAAVLCHTNNDCRVCTHIHQTLCEVPDFVKDLGIPCNKKLQTLKIYFKFEDKYQVQPKI
jgi:hypothetical protein